MYKVKIEEYHGIFTDKAECSTFEDAIKRMVEMYDEGYDDDFLITDTSTGELWPFMSYQLMKDNCQNCGKEVRKMDMFRTRDCQGIPFRFVCSKCYDRIMYGKGFDGQRYTEADECIEPDY